MLTISRWCSSRISRAGMILAAMRLPSESMPDFTFAKPPSPSSSPRWYLGGEPPILSGYFASRAAITSLEVERPSPGVEPWIAVSQSERADSDGNLRCVSAAPSSSVSSRVESCLEWHVTAVRSMRCLGLAPLCASSSDLYTRNSVPRIAKYRSFQRSSPQVCPGPSMTFSTSSQSSIVSSVPVCSPGSAATVGRVFSLAIFRRVNVALPHSVAAAYCTLARSSRLVAAARKAEHVQAWRPRASASSTSTTAAFVLLQTAS